MAKAAVTNRTTLVFDEKKDWMKYHAIGDVFVNFFHCIRKHFTSPFRNILFTVSNIVHDSINVNGTTEIIWSFKNNILANSTYCYGNFKTTYNCFVPKKNTHFFLSETWPMNGGGSTTWNIFSIDLFSCFVLNNLTFNFILPVLAKTENTAFVPKPNLHFAEPFLRLLFHWYPEK